MNFDEIKQHKDRIFNGMATQDIIDAIYKLHIDIYGIEYRAGCRSCYADCFMKIYSYYKKREMNNCDYELKAGAVVLTSIDGSKVMTNANINNELAELILKENKGLIIYFKRYPSDWAERIGIVPKTEVSEEIQEVKEFKKTKTKK